MEADKRQSNGNAFTPSQSVQSVSVTVGSASEPLKRAGPDGSGADSSLDVLSELRSSAHKDKNHSGEKAHGTHMYSIHGEQAARRRAIGELIFFAGTNDLRRCRQIASVWNIRVKEPNVMDYDKRTPLHVAAAEGAFSVVAWLVNEETVNVNPLDRHKKTPLEEAARNDHTEVVRLLSEKGGCIYEEDKLVPLEKSRIKGIVNTRRMMMQEMGWDPEWEVNPKELHLLEKIGSGEFGDVYKAKWHGSFVAAKLLKRSDEIALGDFRTEIAILRKIHHPNTTQFLGACTKQKPYVVITELMACSLSDAFSRTFYTPSVRRQIEVALDFARGMAYLHSRRQPIVHRDLKPANLMISGNLHADTEQLYMDAGVIKVVIGDVEEEVADFGLSKSLVPMDKHGQQISLSANDTFKLTGETGSYRYMAPEVFRHEPYNLKVDVYSFAMIVFQLFECCIPFAGVDPVDAARNAALLGTRPSFPPRKLSNVEMKLRELVQRCWDADAEKRPSFEEIVAILEDLLKGQSKHEPFIKGHSPGDCCSVQ